MESRVLEESGLKAKSEPGSDPPTLFVCRRCGKRSSPALTYCISCGAVLSVERALELECQVDAEDRIAPPDLVDKLAVLTQGETTPENMENMKQVFAKLFVQFYREARSLGRPIKEKA